MGRHSSQSKKKYNKRRRQKKRHERSRLRKSCISCQTEEESWHPSSVDLSVKNDNVKAWLKTCVTAETSEKSCETTLNLKKYKLSKVQSKKVSMEINQMKNSIQCDPLMRHFADIQRIHKQYNQLMRIKNLARE